MPNLTGVRIWLSAAVPKTANAEQAARIEAFAITLARQAFEAGATIVHGAHPSITKHLIAVAREVQAKTGERAPLTILASTFFLQNDHYAELPIAELRAHAQLVEMPAATDQAASLEHLRNALAARADVLVAVGGNWGKAARAGVPIELRLAISRGIPCFLLAGLGGAIAEHLDEDKGLLRHLRNGLDGRHNAALAGEGNPTTLVARVIRQLARLPLGRREVDGLGQRFRILALDGGGIRGAFTAAILMRWEQLTQRRVADYFDLIAGTSTGGILAIGLGLGLTPAAMVEFYREHGPAIFTKKGRRQRWLGETADYIDVKYDGKVLEERLRRAYDSVKPNATLGDSSRRLLITSYNLQAKARLRFRTSHHPDVTGDDERLAVDVARATSAAPTYFDPKTARVKGFQEVAVDGGIWANSPTMAALEEAVSVLKFPLERIDLLSLGTAGLSKIVNAPTMTGKIGWAPGIADLFMNAQQEAALQQAETFLGSGRFVRIDEPAFEEMDDVGALEELIGRGGAVAEQHHRVVLERFVNGVKAGDWRRV